MYSTQLVGRRSEFRRRRTRHLGQMSERCRSHRTSFPRRSSTLACATVHPGTLVASIHTCAGLGGRTAEQRPAPRD